MNDVFRSTCCPATSSAPAGTPPAATAAAYQLAVYQFPPLDEARLEAVLAYTAVCRFRGEWRYAAELLYSEPFPDIVAGTTHPPIVLALAAERLSLDFELGRITDTQSRAKTILLRALVAGEWPLIIAMHRQIGMLAEERGEYPLARGLPRPCLPLRRGFAGDAVPGRPYS